MNPRVTVGLLAVLIALGAYVYWGAPAAAPVAPKPTAKDANPQLDVWTLEEGQIRAVSVRRGGQEAGVERAGEEWRLTPSGEPADRLRVNSLIFRLATIRATFRVANATNDAEFGLAQPSLVAMVRLASGETRTLTVGTKAPAESGTYVRQDGDPAIYLISNALAQDLERIVTEPPRPPSPTPLPSPAASPSPAP
jgi:Domain of unknown function (DUF4340)